MFTCLVFTCIDNSACTNSDALKTEIRAIEHQLQAYCPRVSWHAYYTLSGPGDIMHVLESEDRAQLDAASAYVLGCRMLDTVLILSTAWQECNEIFNQLSSVKSVGSRL